jgi:hypothetical protein
VTTFVAVLRKDSITAPFAVDVSMNCEIFLIYLEQCLVPTLSPGEIVMMDNLPAQEIAGRARGDRGDRRNAAPLPTSIHRAVFRQTQGRRALDPRPLGPNRKQSSAPPQKANYFRHAGHGSN